MSRGYVRAIQRKGEAVRRMSSKKRTSLTGRMKGCGGGVRTPVLSAQHRGSVASSPVAGVSSEPAFSTQRPNQFRGV